jgi:hypothetical protein
VPSVTSHRATANVYRSPRPLPPSQPSVHINKPHHLLLTASVGVTLLPLATGGHYRGRSPRCARGLGFKSHSSQTPTHPPHTCPSWSKGLVSSSSSNRFAGSNPAVCTSGFVAQWLERPDFYGKTQVQPLAKSPPLRLCRSVVRASHLNWEDPGSTPGEVTTPLRLCRSVVRASHLNWEDPGSTPGEVTTPLRLCRSVVRASRLLREDPGATPGEVTCPFKFFLSLLVHTPTPSALPTHPPCL